jgi:hypothetical protein
MAVGYHSSPLYIVIAVIVVLATKSFEEKKLNSFSGLLAEVKVTTKATVEASRIEAVNCDLMLKKATSG